MDSGCNVPEIHDFCWIRKCPSAWEFSALFISNKSLVYLIANLFDQELPTTDYTGLAMKDWTGTIQRAHGVDEIEARTPSLAFLGMFHVRGMHSKQPMQPSVNHRVLNYHSLHNRHRGRHGENHPPLLQTLINNEDIHQFDMGGKIGLCFYEVFDREEKSSDDMRISSHNMISVDIGETTHFKQIHARNVGFKDCTMTSFKRMANLFGAEVKESTDEKVSINHWSNFFSCMASCDTSAPESFKQTIQKCKIDKWCAFDESVSVEENQNRMNEMFQALQPCRDAIYDGQHRATSGFFASIGYYKATNLVEKPEARCMTFKEFKEHAIEKGLFKIDEDKKLADTQIHKGLGVKIGTVSDQLLSLVQLLKVFQKYGRVTTIASQTTVDQTPCTFAIGLLSYIEPCKNELCLPENYWELDKDDFNYEMEKRGKCLAKHFSDFVTENQHESFIESEKIPFADGKLLTTISNELKMKGSWLQKVSWDIKGVPQHMAILLEIIKSALLTPEGHGNLTNFFHRVPVKCKTNRLFESTDELARSPPFFKSRLIEIVENVAVLFRMKMSCELCLMRKMENEEGLCEEIWTAYEKADKVKKDPMKKLNRLRIDLSQWEGADEVINNPKAKDLLKTTNRAIGGDNFGKSVSYICGRLEGVVLPQLVSDFLATMSKHGMNPQLTINSFMPDLKWREAKEAGKHKNDVVRAYLFDSPLLEWKCENIPIFIATENDKNLKQDEPEVDRTVMGLGMQLYYVWITQRMAGTNGVIDVLADYTRSAVGNKDRKKQPLNFFKFGNESGVLKKKVTSAKFKRIRNQGNMVIPRDLLFSSFLDEFLNDRIDVEHDCHKFFSHCKKVWKSNFQNALDSQRASKANEELGISPAKVKRESRKRKRKGKGKFSSDWCISAFLGFNIFFNHRRR